MPANAFVRVQLDPNQPTLYRIFAQKEVVGYVSNDQTQIGLEEARKVRDEIEVGDYLEVEVEPGNFGRIAAQTALQVLKQRIRELEKQHAIEELREREGDVVTGTIQRTEGETVILSIGRVEGILPSNEQTPDERYRFNDRLRVYVIDLREREKGVKALVSRTHPNLVRRLLEMEVPEIQEGLVEIKGVAREAGSRTKVAVTSRNPRIDPVGACIGHRGMRVQAIMDELLGERIDVVPWSAEPVQYITDALSPARVNRVVLDEKHKSALVVVANNQLSLAIGKGGVDVRLASKLTGWKLDVRTEAQLASHRGGSEQEVKPTSKV
jgi:N utilization substance protein A